jgi:hypothetical protein
LRTIYGLQSEVYAVLSLNAWNPWWILQSRLGDGSFLVDNVPVIGPLTPRMLGYAAAGIGLFAVFAAVRHRPTQTSLFLGLAAAVLVAFCLLTTMHERYSFPAIAFLAILFGRRSAVAIWLILAATITANLVAAVPPAGGEAGLISINGPLGIVGSVVMTMVLVTLLWQLRTETRALRGGPAYTRAPAPN